MKTILTFLLMFALADISAQSLPAYVPANGLVGWWPFSGNANDSSGNHIHGVVHGAVPTQDRFGNDTSAYSFNGISDYIETVSSGVSDVKYTSVSAWIKVTGNAGASLPYDTYVQFGLYGNHSFAYGYNYDARVHDTWSYNSNSQYDTIDLRNAWHHIVTVEDSNMRRVYIDGVLEQTVTSVSANYSQGSDVLIFGAAYATGNQFFTGSIDDIGFWDRALTPGEVETLFHASVSVKNAALTGDIAVYPNPAENYLWIEVPPMLQHARYDMTNAMGSSLLHGELTPGRRQVDLGSLPAGMYFLKLSDDKGHASVKKILKR